MAENREDEREHIVDDDQFAVEFLPADGVFCFTLRRQGLSVWMSPCEAAAFVSVIQLAASRVHQIHDAGPHEGDDEDGVDETAAERGN